MQDNVLVIGSGGREYSLVVEIARSPLVKRVFCTPGNDGMSEITYNSPNIAPTDFAALEEFVRNYNIALTVVGPEDPLVNGIVDYWDEKGLVDDGHLIFGPSGKAAQLEGSKSFCKDFLLRHNIPTAGSETFDDRDSAISYVKGQGAPIVIKADGLAQGKGVTVAQSIDEAIDAIERCMVSKEFKDAGSKIVVEEYMPGEEASIMALSDGITVKALIPSQDHKPAFETPGDRHMWLLAGGDKRFKDHAIGPNTGGMGAYAPAPIVTDKIMKEIYDTILLPTIAGMAQEGTPYKGCLYVGLMINDDKPKVVEINCRFGDPETQVVLPMTRNDIYPLLKSCATGTLHEHIIDTSPGACATVAIVSGGYPGSYQKEKVISNLSSAFSIPGIDIVLAGVKTSGDNLVTNGGRVLYVTGHGDDISDAIETAYRGVTYVSFDNRFYRTDIGRKAIDKETGNATDKTISR